MTSEGCLPACERGASDAACAEYAGFLDWHVCTFYFSYAFQLGACVVLPKYGIAMSGQC